MTSQLVTNDVHVWRTVPLKLLPLNERCFTTSWAQDTYCYRFLFDATITSQSYKTDSEVEDWRLQSLQLLKEIKQIGIAHGRQEIVNLARGHYGMTMPHSCNSKPTNINDVISILENEEWYNDNKIFKQNIIYHLMYRLTRSGMNAWLLQQENKWMTERQIKYNEDEVGLRKTKLRGFVYSIMNSKFSNSTIKLFHTVMQRKYGEFITVRKPIDSLSSNFIYSERKFLGGSGYVVVCQNHKNYKDKQQGDTVDLMGRKWVTLCKDKHDMTVDDIHAMVNDWYHNVYDDEFNGQQDFDKQQFSQLNTTAISQHASLVRNQSRVVLPKWYSNLPQREGKIVLILFILIFYLFVLCLNIIY